MTIDEAKRVCVPFGMLHGWPLESVIGKRFWYFNWLTTADLARHVELREAVSLLAGAEAERLRAFRRQKATARENRRRLNAWAFR